MENQKVQNREKKIVQTSVIGIIGNIWTLIGIKQDERNGLHRPISQ